jgi:hypothetical protein
LAANYTLFHEGKTRQGEATSLLEAIRSEASQENEEIRKMNVDQYEDAIIEDAEYFIDEDLLRALQAQPFESKYDRALTYLAQVLTSGIRILTVRAA